MSTIKSSAENLTLNADGAGNDIKFQSNGVEKASIDQDGTVTATNFTGTGGNLTVKSDGATPAIILRDSDNNIDGMFKALNGTVGMQVAGGEWALLATTNAEISLYHDNAVKLATTATGIAITGGVAIGGTGAANTLDDYEEGTWTPTITRNSSAPSVSYSLQVGKYTKIGNMVTIYGDVVWSANTGGSGGARIVLPFTAMSAKYFKPITRSYTGLSVGVDYTPSGYSDGVNLEMQRISQSGGNEGSTDWNSSGRYNFQITILV